MFCVGDSFRWRQFSFRMVYNTTQNGPLYILCCAYVVQWYGAYGGWGWLVVFLNRDRKSLLRWTLAHCCSSVALNLSCLKRDVYVDSYVRWNVCNGETLELLICPRSLIGPPPYTATSLTNHIRACTDCDSNPVSTACFWALVASH